MLYVEFGGPQKEFYQKYYKADGGYLVGIVAIGSSGKYAYIAVPGRPDLIEVPVHCIKILWDHP